MDKSLWRLQWEEFLRLDNPPVVVLFVVCLGLFIFAWGNLRVYKDLEEIKDMIRYLYYEELSKDGDEYEN